jgi:UDP-N-acetylmuramate dehydrogenase
LITKGCSEKSSPFLILVVPPKPVFFHMQIQENVSLKTYNTFGIHAIARWFTVFRSTQALANIFEDLPRLIGNNDLLILGGGSNVLFTKDFSGLVLKNEIPGIGKIREDEDYVYVKAGAGVNWHQLVMYCIDNNLGGMENLSLIPGCTGASPMQNIGAYGVELKDVFHSLEAFHIQDKTTLTFELSDCEFGYRESVFKHRCKGQFIILNVTFRLTKTHVYNIEYGAIKQELEKMNVSELSIRAISQAIINIRQSKLPNPAVIGNAGSFFKNPEISAENYNKLRQRFPQMIAYALDCGNYKLAAGWLIEQCGWKGYREGDAGVHAQQALVLVNYGQASGSQIFQLSQQILESVQEKFDITLQREVNII